ELSLELSLRGPGALVSFEDAAVALGMTTEHAGRVWRALGFPDPLAVRTYLGLKDVEVLRLVAHDALQFLGPDSMMQFARVLGSAMVLLAETIVDGFRVEYEVPQRDAGTRYLDIVRSYSELAADLLPPFVEAMDSILRRQIVAAARNMWAVDESRTTVTRQVTVGFVDLVGYTASTRALSPSALSDAVARFENQVSEVVSSAGGRVVKLIGDEAMFVIDDRTGCDLALRLADQTAADGGAGAVRIGLASGPAVTMGGDYYGDVVNLAARLVKAAEPGCVVVSASVRAAVESGFLFTPLQPLQLKGFDEPVAAFVLTRDH
ncbi:MAG: adenylate/guanylate cyclase domain-containing protein, partial [Actinobacteria bacterium]|nr:adenylate/guanylate cyclase domain-containing protein [Actinomycetota bacterium]